ncbi:hypothetical protein B0T16DRAFT_231211 [Cercophora newfieldiana]|uniref:Uncharacterized protein n=1 Tax=Cercophora newfieldiana TaxID=92897 RepID=A0AA39XSE7_9PEZI|nr:hypothetical protein B0T16DRAFT_231211 [Cercophora newfieldiana]
MFGRKEVWLAAVMGGWELLMILRLVATLDGRRPKGVADNDPRDNSQTIYRCQYLQCSGGWCCVPLVCSSLVVNTSAMTASKLEYLPRSYSLYFRTNVQSTWYARSLQCRPVRSSPVQCCDYPRVARGLRFSTPVWVATVHPSCLLLRNPTFLEWIYIIFVRGRVS